MHFHHDWLPIALVLLLHALSTTLIIAGSGYDNVPIKPSRAPQYEERLALEPISERKSLSLPLEVRQYRNWAKGINGWNVYYTTWSVLLPSGGASRALHDFYRVIQARTQPGGTWSYDPPKETVQFSNEVFELTV